MNVLSEIDKAYFAGLFDGEGCISIAKFQKKPVNINIVYRLSIHLTQNEISFLELWQNKLGIGKIYKLHETKIGKAKGHVLMFGANQAFELLKNIYPYLILKKEQAAVAFEFQSLSQRGKLGRGKTVPPHVVEKREELYVRIRQLKGNGVKETRGRKRTNKEIYSKQEIV